MSRHLIHSQTLDLRYSNATQAKTDMDQWGGWYQREFLPVISEVLDELEIPGKTIRIEKLDIDLGLISKKIDQDILKKKLKEALKNQILRDFPELIKTHPSALPESLPPTRTIDEHKSLEQLIYLLEKGRQPWWASSSKESGIRFLFQKLFREEKSPMLKQWLESQPLSLTAAQRLTNHLPYAELAAIVAWVFPEKIAIWEAFSKSLEAALTLQLYSKSEFEMILSSILTETFFAKKTEQIHAISTWFRSKVLGSQPTKLRPLETFSPILELISEKNPTLQHESAATLELIQKWIQSPFFTKYSQTKVSGDQKEKRLFVQEIHQELAKKLKGNVNSEKENAPTFSKKTRKAEELKADETFPISNAGLVLTAPFLPYFFRGLGLVEKKEFVSHEAQHRAVLLIEALLDKSHAYEESDLLLNKILCGIPPDEAIPVSFSPTELEKEEIQNLLDSMASQWTALRSTSGTSMARGFFPREGSLRRIDQGYELIIPRISIDILLNRLPWTISIIKLPWMNETLKVEW